MKVTNLTDVSTPALAQRGLVNQSLAIGNRMIPPGGSETIDGETFARNAALLQALAALGALACGAVPDAYKAVKGSGQGKKKDPPPLSGGSDDELPVTKK